MSDLHDRDAAAWKSSGYHPEPVGPVPLLFRRSTVSDDPLSQYDRVSELRWESGATIRVPSDMEVSLDEYR